MTGAPLRLPEIECEVDVKVRAQAGVLLEFLELRLTLYTAAPRVADGDKDFVVVQRAPQKCQRPVVVLLTEVRELARKWAIEHNRPLARSVRLFL